MHVGKANGSGLLPRLALAIFVPLLLLVGTETMVRKLHLGYPTSFFLATQMDEQPVWVNNAFYGYRFFSPILARNPAPIRCERAKPDHVVRVVVLGESAAQGDPQVEFGLPRMLEKMLNEGDESYRFEVINAAMTAINSHVIVDIASELRRLEPDVVVVYVGNNEVIGPYGPGTTFTSGAANRLTPLRIRLTRLRIAQLLRAVTTRLTKQDASSHWVGLEFFEGNRLRADDPTLESMYTAFERNLLRIIAYAEAGGARVVLCTVAVNLKDCAPFGSAYRPELSEQERRAWATEYEAGIHAAEQGRHAQARAHFRAALEQDGDHAELVWHLARASNAMGRTEDVAALFARARDLDTQRFRADSRINEHIRRAAAATSATLVDAETAFGVTDRALFLDHVHFTFDGNRRLASLILNAMRTWYPGLHEVDSDTCRTRMFFTPWAVRQQARIMLDRRAQPPFIHQAGNNAQREVLQRIIRSSSAMIASTDWGQMEALYRENRRRDPYDLYYPFQWGAILRHTDRLAEAAEILSVGLDRVTHQFEMRKLPAYVWSLNGNPEQAAQALIGQGPPYGWYLALLAGEIMQLLEQGDRIEEAYELGKNLLEQAARFPGREHIARDMIRLESML